MSEPAQIGSLAAEPLWRPSDAAVAAANMTKFRTQVARDWQIGLKDTDALWAWSTEQVDRFWTSLWRSCDVIGEMGRPALKDGDRMPGAQFFPNARINYAENLLRFSRGNPRDAIVFWGEDKVKRRLARTPQWFGQRSITLGPNLGRFRHA